MKPEVRFRPIENIDIVVGCPTVVFALDHPTRGTCTVLAGRVLNVLEDDNNNVVRFETEDACYVVEGGGDDCS